MIRALRLLALSLLLLAPLEGGSEEPERSFEERLEHFVRERVPGAEASIRVPPLRVSAGERGLDPSFSIHPRQRLTGRVPVRLSLSQGARQVRSLVVPVEVETTRNVLVAARPIRIGDAIGKDAVVVQAVRGQALPDDALTEIDALRGLRAKRNIQVGSVIRGSRLQEAKLIRRGQRIKVVYQSAGLRMELMARAREDGNKGDWIEAENTESRSRVMGVVVADGVLHVVR